MLQAIHAGWVIPVEPQTQVLKAHTVVIEDQLIKAIIPRTSWRAPDSDCIEIERPGHVLIPGLINTHTHAAMSLFRGMADDRPLMEWLENHIWPAEAKFVQRDFVRDGTRLAAAEMLLGGTTCFNDMYFFADETAAAAIEANIRAVVGMIVIGFPTNWAADTDEYFHKGQAVHDQYREHPLIKTAFAPHAPYTVDNAALARVATLAEELDVGIHMHVHETEFEVANSITEHGVRPLQRLTSLGVVSPRLNAVHMTALDDSDIETVARHGVHVTHCPESNLKLASGFCPVRKLRQANINIALGTDGAASNNDLDMLGETQTAALLAKAVAEDPSALPAHAALAMATINGARALGLDQQTGSLEPGKQADVVAVDLERAATQPLYDPCSQLVYSASRDAVTDVWVGGRAVVTDSRLNHLDLGEILAAAERWREQLAG